mmetsp:Transcript_33010/g.71290  ORF Transcript_33010/g.71290 Transcript_33010/m.71290 type:complete len:268 (-) Transcript_33010:41-844(-)
MENSGCTPPGWAGAMPLKNDLIRHVLSTATIRPSATPASVTAVLEENPSVEGGSCSDGCILVFACPTPPHRPLAHALALLHAIAPAVIRLATNFYAHRHPLYSTGPLCRPRYSPSTCRRLAAPFTPSQTSPPAFVYEGDRYGGRMRVPGELRPTTHQGIMASNHYWSYHVDPRIPAQCNGQEASFSSLWRYEAGQDLVEALLRTGERFGTATMRRLLQTVSHGTTEHSVIVRPNAMEIDVAFANATASAWDAPYLDWTTFHFKELFI